MNRNVPGKGFFPSRPSTLWSAFSSSLSKSMFTLSNMSKCSRREVFIDSKGIKKEIGAFPSKVKIIAIKSQGSSVVGLGNHTFFIPEEQTLFIS